MSEPKSSLMLRINLGISEQGHSSRTASLLSLDLMQPIGLRLTSSPFSAPSLFSRTPSCKTMG